MKFETPQDKILVRYLLDDLTEAERQEIEERFFQDDSFFEEITALEDELHYEYRQNHLDKKESATFERKFLQTPQDKAKAAFAGAFLVATSELAGEKASAPRKIVESSTASWWKSFLAFFDFSPMQFGLAAASVLLMLGFGWLFFQNSQLRREMASLQNDRAAEINKQEQIIAEKQRRQAEIEQQLASERQAREQNEQRIREIEEQRINLQREIAQAEQQLNESRRRRNQTPQVPAAAPQPRSVIALSLAPGLFSRSSGEGANRVKLSAGVKTLNLNLLLKNVGEYQSYRASVSNIDEGEIWTGATSQPRGKNAKRSASISIPAEILKRADYELTLSGIKPNNEAEEITTYYFSVVK
jgi:hypothetical protein